MAIGSPNGATWSTLIVSPGTHPISISFKKISLFSNDFISTVSPTGISDSLLNIVLQIYAVCSGKLLRLLEMPANSSKSAVSFHFLEESSHLRDRKRLKAFLVALFKKEKVPMHSLTYVFCSDDYLLGINQQFLQHNYYTDIISFNLAAKGQQIEGEIYISLDRVKDNAKSLRQSYHSELHRVIFHGALHLCGYKDKSAKDILAMRKKEDRCLKRYFD